MPWNAIAAPAGGSFEPLFDPQVECDASAGVDVFIGQRSGVYYTPGGPLGRWGAWGQTNIPTSVTGPGGFGAARLAVSHESDQRLTLFVADDDVNAPIPLTVWQAVQTKAVSPVTNPSGWSHWDAIGSSLGSPGTMLGQPVAGFGSNGALYVFIAVSDPNAGTNSLFVNVETAPGTGWWSDWQDLGGGAVYSAHRPAVVSTADGGIEVFVRDQGSIKHIRQTIPGGGWSNWTTLPGGPRLPGFGSEVAVAVDGALAGARAGCVEVLVVGGDSHLHQISQVSPGTEHWSAWNDLGGTGQSMMLSGYVSTPFASPAIGENGDGTLEAYVVAADNNVYRIRQQEPGGSWAGWASLGSPGLALASNPAVGVITHNYLLQLFVLGEDGNLHHLSQRRRGTW
jgi:hypothetical protein